MISCHAVNYRYNEAMLGQTKQAKASWASVRAFAYVMRKYGPLGFYRGFLPSVLFTTITLWDTTIGHIIKDTNYED